MSYCLRCGNPREAYGIGYCDNCESASQVEKRLIELPELTDKIREIIMLIIDEEFQITPR